jgi:predicted amidohydrolase YtcJ
MTSLLLRDAVLAGDHAEPENANGHLAGASPTDIRVSGGIITELAPALGRRPGEEVIDCAGAAVLPGLTDHHLHLLAMAAARTSVRCGPPEVTSRAALAAALAAAVPDEHGWVRGAGYAESVAGDLDASALDALRADRPVRIQHRSGALWMLNTAALTAIGAFSGSGGPGVELDPSGRPAGRLWRADAWLRGRLPRRPMPSLAPVGEELLGFGITAVTDATPDLAPEAIAAVGDAMRRGELPSRVHLLGVPLGETLPDTPGLTVGPYKIVLADSGLPTYADLAERIATAHGAGRAVAVHCVTREALILLIAVLRELGPLPGDRIEHAALVPAELLEELAALRLRVVTQPGFLADRGDDFLRDLSAADHPDLYRCASLDRAGVALALSSDAPYGPLSPWTNITAAITRQTASGRIAGAAERLTATTALNAYLAPPEAPGGEPASIRPGQPASLVVLSGPRPDLLARHRPVRAVLAAGRLRAQAAKANDHAAPGDHES